jgi:Heparinase II/III-like protein/Heparinase II/III N-terminus
MQGDSSTDTGELSQAPGEPARVWNWLKMKLRRGASGLANKAEAAWTTALAHHVYPRIRVPAWNEIFAARLRRPESAISRLLAPTTTSVYNAERILAGDTRLLSTVINCPGSFPDWHRDYFSGHRYPLLPYVSYDMPEDRHVDIVVPWELSRLQFVPTLVCAYRATGDHRYADFFFSALEEWQSQNPCLLGVNWISGMDVAIRALQIGIGLAYFGAEGGPQTQVGTRLLWAHLMYLEERDLYLPKTTVNNHQIVSALLHYALLHFFDPEVTRPWSESVKLLIRHEIQRQFRADGGHFESALQYHNFVLECVFVVVGLLAGDEDPETILADPGPFGAFCRERIERATRFAADCCRAWGETPRIGDSSDGRILYHADYFAWTAGDCSYLHDWAEVLFPHANPFSRPASEIPPVYASSGLGLYVGERYSALLCALPVSKDAGGHNHLDKTSILLRVGNTPVLVDSGTYCYTHDLTARCAHREGRAHNVLLIDGKDQAAMSGSDAFAAPEYGEVGICYSGLVSEAPEWQMWHDGYARQPGLGRVRRRVRCEAGALQIEDAVEGEGTHRLEIVFNLHPSTTARAGEGVIVISTASLEMCAIRPPHGWEIEVQHSCYSDGYRQHESGRRVICATTAHLPCAVVTEVTIPGLP